MRGLVYHDTLYYFVLTNSLGSEACGETNQYIFSEHFPPEILSQPTF